jgi:hypothetical protein
MLTVIAGEQSMKRYLLAPLAAALLCVQSARADDDRLDVEPLLAPIASLAPGATSSVKVGDVIYWEDERTVTFATIPHGFEVHSGLLDPKRVLRDGERLRKAQFRGKTVFCLLDQYAVRQMKVIVCLGDDNNDGAFERYVALLPGYRATAGDLRIGAVINDDKLEQPQPYHLAPGYRSLVGFRAVLRYRGIKDGQLVVSCSLEPKGQIPAGLNTLMYHGKPPVDAETTIAIPPAMPFKLAVPVCFDSSSMAFLRQITNGQNFSTPMEDGDRPALLEVSRADEQGIAFKFVRPFAGWTIAYEEGPGQEKSLAFQQLDK